ncbi:MAG: LysM peptidoglycan-binding domain-containing protein [bacterium]
MKTILYTLVLTALVALTIRPGEKGRSTFLQQEPPAGYCSENESLSKIAFHYYGESSYWRELALINRVPDAHLLYPAEEILVPSFQVIQKIRCTKRGGSVKMQSKSEDNRELQLPDIPFDTEYRIVEKKARVRYAIIIIGGLVSLGCAVQISHTRSVSYRDLLERKVVELV